eukprot:996083-Rhodomonas_salina.4
MCTASSLPLRAIHSLYVTPANVYSLWDRYLPAHTQTINHAHGRHHLASILHTRAASDWVVSSATPEQHDTQVAEEGETRWLCMRPCRPGQPTRRIAVHSLATCRALTTPPHTD